MEINSPNPRKYAEICQLDFDFNIGVQVRNCMCWSDLSFFKVSVDTEPSRNAVLKIEKSFETRTKLP